ncbi:hypothetical protein GGI23_001189 [Coemansia sp. RSA 2559]|nr:hypothetical protein GGI23_001189 [Coemansia sp. RSA 2559]
MRALHVASILHIVLASFLLWVVPLQYAFFADLAAFPVALFVLVRDIVSSWYASAITGDLQRRGSIPDQSTSKDHEAANTEIAAESSGVRKRATAARARRGSDGPDPTVSAAANASCTAGSRLGDASGVPKSKIILLVVQIALFAMVLDFVYRPLVFPGDNLLIFRPGFVAHDSAKLHIRYADGGKLELRYRTLTAKAGGAAKTANVPWDSAGLFDPPTDHTDYTQTVSLEKLKPATRYAVELHNLTPTLHAKSVLLGSVEFTTSPVPGQPTRMRFGTGSCIKPNFPYRPGTPDVYGFSSMLEHSDSLDMIMFLGDFVYADLPLYFGAEADDYRRLYRQVYMAPSTRRLARKVPMLHVYDDHEIKNNWHSNDSPPMGSAMAAYAEYNGRPNPPPPVPDVAYYNFTYGDIAFYAWDTRRYRTLWEEKGSKDGGEKSMLGAAQKAHFTSWLRDVNHTAAVKFVVSSVPVTTGWSNKDSNQDTWRGYPTERAEILQLTQHVPNLFFLSGDRHEMAAVQLPSGNIEFSTSPVSQFTFPFIGMFAKDSEGESTLHYRRPGHVKYGILDVDTQSDPDIPRVTYSLYTTDVDKARSPAWVYKAKGAPWR